MWLSLAAEQGEENAIASRDLFAGKMAVEEVSRAQELTREWKELSSMILLINPPLVKPYRAAGRYCAAVRNVEFCGGEMLGNRRQRRGDASSAGKESG